jgi:hypothetical protein
VVHYLSQGALILGRLRLTGTTQYHERIGKRRLLGTFGVSVLHQTTARCKFNGDGGASLLLRLAHLIHPLSDDSILGMFPDRSIEEAPPGVRWSTKQRRCLSH